MSKERKLPKAKLLGEWAYLAIKKHFHKILKHEDDVLKDRNPEALHQMRVGMRRLRSAVTGLAVAVDLPKVAREKQIAKIARSLGKLRDFDVLLDALENIYKPHLPSKEASMLEKALVKLTKQRREAFTDVEVILKHERYKLFKQALKEWLEKPIYEEIAFLPIQDVLPDLLLPEVSRLFLHSGWLVGLELKGSENGQNGARSPELAIASAGEILHSLRKQVKRVRYQMNLFSPLYGSNYDNYLQDMKQIQTVLGELQDNRVLAEVLTDILQEPLERVMPMLTEQLAQTRARAWANWQPLQQRYINPEMRLAWRSELLHPLCFVKEKLLVSPAEIMNEAREL
ncbi:MAG: CHAD domain-containing protein [Oscillatoriaceae bacterium SKW80]|nr:CHAD domain-containing protein [Oscillatoriaceae bacterium SKYG93]MCX8120369.1 CHAD domain-containing protein [Oscillatoriaceae bacterium SKW80]MDW8453295.1 CHAD domain-containing protein [Oscillatoriaceae cyanobacterium SKYGB_i_bin93]HIK27263.1 CHAD domain-containing protein [Oscillatoriaceae cyanobacterium M7585_C2015_266]